MSRIASLAWVDGAVRPLETATVSAASASHQYGIGVFDGLMAYRTSGRALLFRAREHLERFTGSTAQMGLRLSWTAEAVEAAVHELLAALDPRDWYIRPLATLPGPRIVLTPDAADEPARLAIFAMEVNRRETPAPLRCQISGYERVSGRAIPVRWKTFGAYTNSYLVRREAQQAGFDDGVMLDREGHVAECSAANLFFLRGSELVTPSLTDDIFPGITRGIVLQLAHELGLCCEERKVAPSELDGFEAAFAGATLMELRPIVSIGDVKYAADSHPCFRCLLHGFRELTV